MEARLSLTEWPLQWIALGIALANRDLAADALAGERTWLDHPQAQSLAEAIRLKSRSECARVLEQMGVELKPGEKPATAVMRWAMGKDAAVRRKALLASVQGMSEAELLGVLECRNSKSTS